MYKALGSVPGMIEREQDEGRERREGERECYKSKRMMSKDSN